MIGERGEKKDRKPEKAHEASLGSLEKEITLKIKGNIQEELR